MIINFIINRATILVIGNSVGYLNDASFGIDKRKFFIKKQDIGCSWKNF